MADEGEDQRKLSFLGTDLSTKNEGTTAEEEEEMAKKRPADSPSEANYDSKKKPSKRGMTGDVLIKSSSSPPDSWQKQKPSSRILKAKPKRPLTGYNRFFKEERVRWIEEERIKKEQGIPRDYEDDNSFLAMGKEISARWIKLTEEEKEKYKAAYRADLVHYKKEMEEFRDQEEQAIEEMKQASANEGLLQQHFAPAPTSILVQQQQTSTTIHPQGAAAVAAQRSLPGSLEAHQQLLFSAMRTPAELLDQGNLLQRFSSSGSTSLPLAGLDTIMGGSSALVLSPQQQLAGQLQSLRPNREVNLHDPRQQTTSLGSILQQNKLLDALAANSSPSSQAIPQQQLQQQQQQTHRLSYLHPHLGSLPLASSHTAMAAGDDILRQASQQLHQQSQQLHQNSLLLGDLVAAGHRQSPAGSTTAAQLGTAQGLGDGSMVLGRERRNDLQQNLFQQREQELQQLLGQREILQQQLLSHPQHQVLQERSDPRLQQLERQQEEALLLQQMAGQQHGSQQDLINAINRLRRMREGGG